MRAFKIILIIIFIIIALAAIAGVIFIKTFDINRYKPQIISAARSSLGRALDFDSIDINISLTQGIRVAVNKIALGEHPDIGTGEFMTVQQVYLGVDVLAYLLKKQISISKVQVSSPRLTIIRTKVGAINAQMMGPAAPVATPSNSAAVPAASSDQSAAVGKPKASSEAALPPVFVDAIEVTDATITFIDRTFDPPMSLEIKQLALGVNGFSLEAPFPFYVAGLVLGNEENFRVEGRAQVDPKTFEIQLTRVNSVTDLQKFSLDKIRQLPVIPKDVPFPEVVEGKLIIAVKELNAGMEGLKSIAADLQLEKGKVIIKEVAPGIGFSASQIDITIKNFALGDNFQVKGSMAYLSDKPNIAFESNGRFDMQTQQISLSGFEAKTELSSYSMDQLRQSAPALKGVPLPQSQKGGLNVFLRSLTAGPAGLISLNGVSDLSNGQVVLKELAVPVDQIDAKIELSESTITLPASSFRIGLGKVGIQGKIENYLTTQGYQFKTKMDSLSIIEMVDQKDLPVKLHGLISGDLDLSGKGFDPDKMFDALKGQGDFTIAEGKLTDINILKLVLDQLNFVPNLRQTLEAGLPQRFKDKIKQKDTIITAVKLKIGIESDTIVLNSLDMVADGFLFEGQGKAGFDQSFNFEGSFIIPQDMAQSMSKAVGEFELLYDDQGQIRFPLKVSGKGSAVKFSPDMQYITTNAVRNKGREELQKVLDKAFEKNKPGAQEDPTETDPSAPVGQKQKAPEQILIESVLDSIFKK